MDTSCRPLYRWACPNCEKTNSEIRLRVGAPCERCLPHLPSEDFPTAPEEHRGFITRALEQVGTLRPESLLAQAERVDRALDAFRRAFHTCVGASPWHIQEMWARRVLQERSFAMIAPTGVGKTTFGGVMALHRALTQAGRTVFILPTVALTRQVGERLTQWAEQLAPSNPPQIITIHSRLPARQKRLAREQLVQGKGDVLVVTAAFLRRSENVEHVRQWGPSFVFVDDVDAVLKSGRIVEGVLAILGVTDELLHTAQELIRLRRSLATVQEGPRRERLLKRRHRLQGQIRQAVAGKTLVVSSATGRPRGRRVLLFREIFGFEIGGRADIARNIVDVAWQGDEDALLPHFLDVLPRLGTGGLIFVPRDEGVERATAVAEMIGEHTDLRAAVFTSEHPDTLDAFAAGHVDVLVGVATPYGVMVRGLDLPERIRYAVFLHAPRHKIPLQPEAQTPADMARLLALLPEVMPPEEAAQARRLAVRLRQLLRRYPSLARADSLDALPPSSPAREPLVQAQQLLRAFWSLPDARERLAAHPSALVREEDGRFFLYLPDWTTYIQASGRTSRLFVGGITRGLSLVFESEPRILRGLERRLRFLLGDFAFRRLDEIDLDQVLAEVDRDRDRLRRLQQGQVLSPSERTELARTALIVVESPNKARTIAHFFGRPGVLEVDGLRVYETSIGHVNLTIAASGGHVYDLAVDDLAAEREQYGFAEALHGVGRDADHFWPVYTSIKRCQRCGYQFTDDRSSCPVCRSTLLRDARSVVHTLRALALEVQDVYIATDPDTEGEKIAFDLTRLLAPFHPGIRRMEFHEVTRRAILHALAHPRSVNLSLVEAQIVRRVDDRWLGFTLSQRVSEALGRGSRRGRTPLSAGRVQTPVLGWIIERYEEHERSKEPHWVLDLPLAGDVLHLTIPQSALAAQVENGEEVVVRARPTEETEETLRPRPPYTTDALIYDASRYLGLSASRTMQLAQNLFEWGLITYHRTDSTHVSAEGIRIAREYLQEYRGGAFAPWFRPRPWGEEGAHEAIRPTRPLDARGLQEMLTEGVMEWSGWEPDHARLYDLIFRRFIASQMAPVPVRRQRVLLQIARGDERLWSGEVDWLVPAEEGFLHFYSYPYVVHGQPVPPEGQELVLRVSEDQWRVMAKVGLLSTGDVVRLMRERGIGRPSTYHKIVDVLLRRRYVRATGSGLVPTRRGRAVYQYLSQHYPLLVSEQATRTLEEWMDAVARGERSCGEILEQVYGDVRRVMSND